MNVDNITPPKFTRKPNILSKSSWAIVFTPENSDQSKYKICRKDKISPSQEEKETIVVTSSDSYYYLHENFEKITKQHTESTLKGLLKEASQKRQNELFLKVHDKGTQTEPMLFQSNYLLQYFKSELRNGSETFFTVLKSELENAINKLESIKTSCQPKEEPKSPNNNDSSDNSYINYSISDSNTPIRPKNEMIQEVVCDMINIGSKGTKIPRSVYDLIKWTDHSSATRRLLITLFSRKTLATHSLTGKPSPAFLNTDKKTKQRLNPIIVADIVEEVAKKCKVKESMVRNIITTKCADENKLYRKRLEKGNNSDEENEDFLMSSRKKKVKRTSLNMNTEN